MARQHAMWLQMQGTVIVFAAVSSGFNEFDVYFAFAKALLDLSMINLYHLGNFNSRFQNSFLFLLVLTSILNRSTRFVDVDPRYGCLLS